MRARTVLTTFLTLAPTISSSHSDSWETPPLELRDLEERSQIIFNPCPEFLKLPKQKCTDPLCGGDDIRGICNKVRFVFLQPISSLFKQIRSTETLSRCSRAPPKRKKLTKRNTTVPMGRRVRDVSAMTVVSMMASVALNACVCQHGTMDMLRLHQSTRFSSSV